MVVDGNWTKNGWGWGVRKSIGSITNRDTRMTRVNYRVEIATIIAANKHSRIAIPGGSVRVLAYLSLFLYLFLHRFAIRPICRPRFNSRLNIVDIVWLCARQLIGLTKRVVQRPFSYLSALFFFFSPICFSKKIDKSIKRHFFFLNILSI